MMKILYPKFIGTYCMSNDLYYVFKSLLHQLTLKVAFLHYNFVLFRKKRIWGLRLLLGHLRKKKKY